MNFVNATNEELVDMVVNEEYVKGLGSAPITGLSPTLAADLVDYGEWKSGIHAEGFAFSATSFGTKIGAGLGAAMTGWALAFGNYDPKLAVQTAATKQAIIFMNAGMLIATGIILILLFLFWNYEKLYPTICADMTRARNGEKLNNSL